MCRICDDLIIERAIIDKELREMPCGKRPLKQPHRRSYFREYYQANRERKLAAANARNRVKDGHFGDIEKVETQPV